MDPVTIAAIVAALSSGAAVTLGGALSEAGKDAYTALKMGVQRLVAPADIEKLEQDPESIHLQDRLTAQLSASDPALVAELAPLAQTLRSAINVEGDAAIVQAEKVEGGVHQGDIHHHNYELPPGWPDLIRATIESARGPSSSVTESSQLLQRFEAISGQLGVTKIAVANMLRVLGEQEVPPEQLDAKLREIAERHKDLAQRLRALSNDDPRVMALRKKAANVLEAGDYDRADQFLSEAEALDERAIAEQQDALDRRKLSAAQTLAERGELERARLNYLMAAEHFGAAAARVPDSEEEACWRYLMTQASVLDDHGREFGENQSLVRAVAIYRTALNLSSRDHIPLAWAATQNNLGNTLKTLGERESGTDLLEQSVDSLRAALEEYTRKRVPLAWAMTQNNLGNALSILGERESGTDRLEEAVTAYRAALEERTRERVPLDWATTQNNLGNALSILGERESGTDRLEEAITAYRAALEEYTRKRVPLDWAATQNNLGNALRTLGQRESDTDRLEEAVTAYRAALEERTRERVPLDWAMTQNNLGTALQTLGERESGTDRLEEAVTAYRAALEEYTRERVPLGWAMTQNNLGAALDVFEAAGAEYFIGGTKRNLERAEALLSERQGD